MMKNYYKIIVSPETIKSDLNTVVYQGQTIGVYSGMTDILSGGTNGNSLLTGLTIPILITETINDIGYYDPFDGEMTQKDVVNNFIVSASTTAPYDVYLYNTSNEYNKFVELSKYYVDWGDNSQKQLITDFSPNFYKHTYPQMSKLYEITIEQEGPWGITKVTKNILLPYKDIKTFNPTGTATFLPKLGGWETTLINYDYIFTGDSVNNVTGQSSSNFVSTPFFVSGATISRLNDLEQYGSEKYPPIGVPIFKDRQIFGVITEIQPSLYTGYTIQDIDYYDYEDGRTLFFAKSSGFTEDNLTSEAITKNEVLLKVIDQPQIQTNVFIERGKNSAYERIQRLGEVDNLGDMVNYGYGFFNVEKKA